MSEPTDVCEDCGQPWMDCDCHERCLACWRLTEDCVCNLPDDDDLDDEDDDDEEGCPGCDNYLDECVCCDECGGWPCICEDNEP